MWFPCEFQQAPTHNCYCAHHSMMQLHQCMMQMWYQAWCKCGTSHVSWLQIPKHACTLHLNLKTLGYYIIHFSVQSTGVSQQLHSTKQATIYCMNVRFDNSKINYTEMVTWNRCHLLYSDTLWSNQKLHIHMHLSANF